MQRKRLSCKGISTFVTTLSDDEHEEIFLGKGGKGKCKRRSSGKRAGRKGNPKGRDGTAMKCFECQRTDHPKRDFPNKGSGKGASSSSNWIVPTSETNYVETHEELHLMIEQQLVDTFDHFSSDQGDFGNQPCSLRIQQILADHSETLSNSASVMSFPD